jgi:hypothetical protein
MEKLIIGPFKATDDSTLIIIDALDGCRDEEPASAILSVLSCYVNEIPNMKFFVTRRPEPHIRSGFRLELLVPITEVLELHEVKLKISNRSFERGWAALRSKISTPLPGLETFRVAVQRAYLVSCANSRVSDTTAPSSLVQRGVEELGHQEPSFPLVQRFFLLDVARALVGEMRVSATNRNYKGLDGHPIHVSVVLTPRGTGPLYVAFV